MRAHTPIMHTKICIPPTRCDDAGASQTADKQLGTLDKSITLYSSTIKA